MEASDLLYRSQTESPASSSLIARTHRRSDVPADAICVAGLKLRAHAEPKRLRSKIDRQMLGVRKGDMVSLEAIPSDSDSFHFALRNDVLPGTQVFSGLTLKTRYRSLPDMIPAGDAVSEFHALSDFCRRVPLTWATSASRLHLSHRQVPIK
jgi:hypothetical protein